MMKRISGKFYIFILQKRIKCNHLNLEILKIQKKIDILFCFYLPDTAIQNVALVKTLIPLQNNLKSFDPL